MTDKNMKIAFFIDGSRIAEKVINLNDKLVNNVFYEVLIVILLATTLIIVLSILRAKSISFKMTSGIIRLYETLY